MCLGLGAVLEGLSLRDVAQERRGGGAVVVDLFTRKKKTDFFCKAVGLRIFFWGSCFLGWGKRKKRSLVHYLYGGELLITILSV